MKKIFFTIALFVLSIATSLAQDGPGAETLKSANDPMANVKSFNVQNYIISSLHGVPDAHANQLMFRYAQPIGKILLRATLPVSTSSVPNQAAKSGLDDLNLFAIYSVNKDGNKFGIGPLLTMPTGSNGFGADKWQTGVAALAFLAKDPVFQSGALLQWQTSFAGSSKAKDINLLTSQVFGMWQLGGGTYLRSTGIWSFNLQNGDYNIPLGLGLGKVLPVNQIVFNIFAEPQYSVLTAGIGQSRFQIFTGINMQF